MKMIRSKSRSMISTQFVLYQQPDYPGRLRNKDQRPRPEDQMSQPDAIPELLLAQARAGDAAALGQLFELYRNYLRLIARPMIEGR